MPIKLSAEQTRVVEYLRTHGGVLVRVSGGFWTTAGGRWREAGMGLIVPEWYTTVQTVRAMEKKGLLVRLNRFPEEWRDDRRLA